MKILKRIGLVLVILAILALSVLGFVFAAPNLSELQLKTFMVVGIICGASVLYCFIVGEISRNNSQMDKLWSLLPIAYTWVIAGMGGMKPRLVITALLVTIWGIRLTINFARKGAYSIKFWTGEEDYRWRILRTKKPLTNKFVWAIFDLLFICLYQNTLVLATCLPGITVMEVESAINIGDMFVIIAAVLFLILEIVADEQQMDFHTTKNKLLKEGKKLEELPAPFNKGFNTVGLWKRSRHPNYCGEQGFWLSLYFFVVSSGVATYGVFNWTMIGPLFLVLLFLGSSAFSEGVSSKKYPEYARYNSRVAKYIPLWKYRSK